MDHQRTAPADPNPSVAVLGGGIAGIAAAMCLLDLGYQVTLGESRRYLGGRAFSFADGESGDEVDNGQHIFMGCCAYYIWFLQRLGVFEQCRLQPAIRVPIFNQRGKRGLLASSPVPAPFHLLPSLLTYPHLTWAERLRALFALACARFTRRHSPRLENMTFYQWLRERGQTDRTVANLWDLLIVGTLNDSVRDVSASMGLMILQDGMLRGRHSADIGYALGSLGSVTGMPARSYLEERGAAVLLGRPVRRIWADGDTVTGVELGNGETLRAGAYVSALPFGALLGVLPPATLDLPFFQNLRGLESSPIVNVHLWYDRPVMEGDFCAFVDSPVQWVFNKGGTGKTDGKPFSEQGQRLCISLSAAWQHADQPREDVARRLIDEMARIFPLARQTQVRRALVVKQRDATFRCLPGVNEIRPGSVTPLDNLYLAGEWTATGWPSTMEGAVRSGYNAAQALDLRCREGEAPPGG